MGRARRAGFPPRSELLLSPRRDLVRNDEVEQRDCESYGQGAAKDLEKREPRDTHHHKLAATCELAKGEYCSGENRKWGNLN